jgi:hypothetical protein
VGSVALVAMVDASFVRSSDETARVVGHDRGATAAASEGADDFLWA